LPPLPDPALPPLPAPAVPPVPLVALSTQLLFSQCWFDPQAWPQLPQFRLSLETLAQEVPQTISPAVPHSVTQMPLAQSWLAAQAFVQLPQWAPSDGVQEPLQSSNPA
jgi:hypothetical protein